MVSRLSRLISPGEMRIPACSSTCETSSRRWNESSRPDENSGVDAVSSAGSSENRREMNPAKVEGSRFMDLSWKQGCPGPRAQAEGRG